MSNADLISTICLAYDQVAEVAGGDLDFEKCRRTLRQLKRMTKLDLQGQIAILHDLYPIQVEETVVDCVLLVARSGMSKCHVRAKRLMYDLALVWLCADVNNDGTLDNILRFIKASDGNGDFFNPSLLEEIEISLLPVSAG